MVNKIYYIQKCTEIYKDKHKLTNGIKIIYFFCLRFVHCEWFTYQLICSVTDPCTVEPPSYPAFPANPVDTFPLPFMPPAFPDHSHIAPTVKQEEHLLREAVPNGCGLGTRVIAPSAVPQTIVMPDTMADSPMPEVRPEVESQVHTCLSDLLSSPHMLPRKHGIFLYILTFTYCKKTWRQAVIYSDYYAVISNSNLRL